MVNNLDSTEAKVTLEQAVKLCDRNFGVGTDGVIFAMPRVNGTDYTIRLFNLDVSELEMCGNGVRCFAKFIADLNNLQGKHSFTVHTGAGLIIPEIQDDGKNCTVDLPGGPLEIEWREADNRIYMTGPAQGFLTNNGCKMSMKLRHGVVLSVVILRFIC